MDLPVYDTSTAPAASRPVLQAVQKDFGFVPNLMGVFAGAPSTLRAYLALSKEVDASSLSPTETQVVLLAASEQNACGYCVAAHTTIAGMQKVDADVVDAVREGRPIDDPKLEALRTFARAVVEKRGWLETGDKAAFEAAGYTAAHALEVITAVAMKTLSNYVNHIAETPLDRAFEAAAWTRTAGAV